jgi:ubiquinone/menaquinone biosynthesis C-methylase UbiE
VEPTEHNRRAWDESHRRPESAPEALPDAVRALLPEITGKHVLHVPCGTGEVTAELVELGALVTGVDLSAEAIAAAQERAPTAAFVVADVEELPLQLTRARFDVVYAAPLVQRLRDLDAWAANVAAALRPGGALVVYDDHPVAAAVDGMSHWRGDYFADVAPWQLGRIVTAIARVGLAVRSLEELSSTHRTQWRKQDPRVPARFVLLATKPA